MLMLMAVRNAKSVIRRTDTYDYRLHDVRGKELRDLTVGVVGTGRIGSAVLDRLRGFSCRTLAYGHSSDNPLPHVPFDELLEQSDVVTLHTPLTADTHHLLDRRRIEQLKHGAFIINTGRGPLLDTESLLSALESGKPERWPAYGGAAGQSHRDAEPASGAGGRGQTLPSCAWVMLSTIARPRPTPACVTADPYGAALERLGECRDQRCEVSLSPVFSTVSRTDFGAASGAELHGAVFGVVDDRVVQEVRGHLQQESVRADGGGDVP